LISGKLSKATKKTIPKTKTTKANTNTPPTSKKKALQGILVLRPSFLNVNDKKFEKNKFDDLVLSPTLPSLIVGRSSKQNDRITFDIAKDHHLWFHVQGSPGSHVLLQLEPGDRSTPEGLQYAADVAAFYSKARGNNQVPVGYTSPKHVKRITGGSPGMVSILKSEGMVYGNPDKGKIWVEKYGTTALDIHIHIYVFSYIHIYIIIYKYVHIYIY
jgi:predicted ribosome quality control (RQC) complex YloA/Tae2 family protein